MKGIILLFALVFIFFMLWVAIWKILEPKKSVEEILNSIKDILTAPNTPPVPLYPVANLYDNHQVDYENFSVIVRDCLLAVGGKCGLSAPRNPFQIHCVNVSSRVIKGAGGFTFNYDVETETPAFKDIVNKVDHSVPADDIARIFRDNLRVHSRGGYVYRDILIWPMGSSVRVEVQGVDRICPPVGGIVL